jgi:fused signal recognition particle receptor
MARIIRKAGDLPRRSLWQRIKDLAMTDIGVLARGGVRAGNLERLEELLLEADFGVPVTLRLVAEVERRALRGEIRTEAEFLAALQREIAAALEAGNSSPQLARAPEGVGPTVVLVMGVNGSGKTTFAAKLAAFLVRRGERVLLAAADTFRAGALDQLRVWSERVGADFVAGRPGGDPAAVAFDALEAASSRGASFAIIDTAGRLHTSGGLMEELSKVVRVIRKKRPDAPNESLLVLDGTIGQNAVAQARSFAAAVPVTGLVVTKVDGTARGGIVVAVHEAIGAPVKFLGTGEKLEDLVVFDPVEFAAEVLES